MTNTKFHFERLFYKAMVGTGIGGKRDEIIRDAKRKQKYVGSKQVQPSITWLRKHTRKGSEKERI